MTPLSDEAETVRRPADHVDAPEQAERTELPRQPGQARLGVRGWARWFWRQITSMRTALILLLLLAFAAIPGSLVPQRSADPNGVFQYREQHPELFKVLDFLQVFDTYTSVWFSAIYLLLFVSLIGCVLPRTITHLQALFAPPPRTPSRLNRMIGYTERTFAPEDVDEDSLPLLLEKARRMLKARHYRVTEYEVRGGNSISAERGYLRESGNLLFHIALLGVLAAVAFGGGFGYTAQRVVATGQTFVNTGVNYDSFNPGRFVNQADIAGYSLTLDDLEVKYETENPNAIGSPIDYTARVTAQIPGQDAYKAQIKVNEPLDISGTEVFLLGNGYAPTVTVRDPDGKVVFHESTVFLPQDAALTSMGVIKIADGLPTQLGMVGFFYPTKHLLSNGALTSINPDTLDPELTLRVYSGDLGLDDGKPVSVYALDPEGMNPIAAPGADIESLQLAPGESVDLPGGLGSITFDGVKRYASLDIHHDPGQVWVALFAALAVLGLLTSLFVPRRRMWVKATRTPDGGLKLEYAGLARGEDPTLAPAVADFVARHSG